MRAPPVYAHPRPSDARRLRRSDLLGVALGTAALEIAKAGLGVEPSWWPADLVAIVLGCLLGVFLPVLVKYGDKLAQGMSAWKKWAAGLSILLIFVSVLTVGIPADRKADVPGTVIASIVMISLILFFLVFFILIIPLCKYDANMLPQQWAILKTPLEKRTADFQARREAKTFRRLKARANAKIAAMRLRRAMVGDAKPLLSEGP